MEAQHPSCSLRSGLLSPLTEGTFSIPSELLFRLSLAIFFTVVPPHLNSLNDENAGAPCKDRIRSLPHPCSPDKVCCLNVNCWRAGYPPYTFHIKKSGLKRFAGHMWLIDSLADDARLTLFIIPDVRHLSSLMLAAHLALLPRWPSKGLYLGLRVRSPLLSLLQMAEPHTWVLRTRRN